MRPSAYIINDRGRPYTGELELPLEWFENLEESGLALYIEPGLWIAASRRRSMSQL
jgi:hypothetical protein